MKNVNVVGASGLIDKCVTVHLNETTDTTKPCIFRVDFDLRRKNGKKYFILPCQMDTKKKKKKKRNKLRIAVYTHNTKTSLEIMIVDVGCLASFWIFFERAARISIELQIY